MEGYATNLRGAMTGAVRFTENSGLIDDGPLIERLKPAFGDTSFNDAHIPLYIVSTDFYTGESVVHDDGPVLDALRAPALPFR